MAWVAVYNENVIGWIHAFQSFCIESLPFIEIGGLVVDEIYRGKRVGKTLMKCVKEWCIDQEIYSMRVRTQSKRMDAHEFYKALRFKEIKEQKVFQLDVRK